jgi:hypothetical protein
MIVQGEINFTVTTVGGALLPSLEQLKTTNLFGPGALIAKVSPNITSNGCPTAEDLLESGRTSKSPEGARTIPSDAVSVQMTATAEPYHVVFGSAAAADRYVTLQPGDLAEYCIPQHLLVFAMGVEFSERHIFEFGYEDRCIVFLSLDVEHHEDGVAIEA